MRRKLVVANWKMHGSKALVAELVPSILSDLAGSADIAICPPFCYLSEVAGLLGGGPVALGAQSVSSEDEGAFTGEVAARMLADCGCRYVIVGHSERRARYGETSNLVAVKAAQVLSNGLIPIICVGESLAEREADRTLAVIDTQLDAVFAAVRADRLDRAVIAYEPVWAIGSGLTASPEQAQQVHAHIRQRCADHGALAVRILYGGSVKADNAAALFAQPDIDGGLIGGASLNAQQFTAICKAAE